MNERLDLKIQNADRALNFLCIVLATIVVVFVARGIDSITQAPSDPSGPVELFEVLAPEIAQTYFDAGALSAALAQRESPHPIAITDIPTAARNTWTRKRHDPLLSPVGK